MSEATGVASVIQDIAPKAEVEVIRPEPRKPVVFDTKKPLTKGMKDVPRPYKGLIVLHYRDGIKSDAGVPAIVTQVGMESHLVALRLLAGFDPTSPFVEAIRHYTDPRLKEDYGEGAWGHVEPE